MAAGDAQTKNCDVGDQNIGCGYTPSIKDTTSYGDTFNAVGGGIYAMQWDDDYIKVWHFDRNSAPADISAKKPKPDGWGKPQAVYGGKSCDVKSHFRDMSIVLNINFCGDYGNAIWSSSGCSALAPTCSDWVAKNPAAFANAYWDVNYIDAYVQGAGGYNTAPGSLPSYSQPTNVPTASFSSFPGTASSNGSYTRFPVGNSSTTARPTNGSTSESTVWTTKTRTDTTTVTVLPSSIPTAMLPSPSDKSHANPANLNEFSYLGCFGSNSDFKSFNKVADSADMDLKKCIGLCQGKKYAGVFNTSCYCASELDADTRVSSDTCDTQCPGDSSQFCGGRVQQGNKYIDNINAKANITLPETSTSASGIHMPLETDDVSGGRPSGVGGNSTSPEQPIPSGSGSPITKGNSTAPETPKVVNLAAKFNSTGPEILPAIPGSSVSSSAASSSTASSSSAVPITTGIAAPAKFNSTGPEIPAPAPILSETTSSDVAEVTIPVYPQPKEKNVTGQESQQTTTAGSTAGSTASGPAVVEKSPAPGVLRNSTIVGRAARALKKVHPGMMDRRAASDFLLSVYAAVAKEDPPKQPPGMGIHTPNTTGAGAATDAPTHSTTNTIVTTITYQTVHPTNPAQIINQEYVTTVVEVHCGCTESTSSSATPVPMTTKVVPCSSCGPQGENHLTVTVPHTVTIATPPSSPTGTAASTRVPPAPSSSIPIVAGASGLKVTSMLFTTMLAMVLLL